MEINDYVKKSEEYFLKGYNCCQAVAASFSDVTGLPEETLLKVSCALGGGFSRLRNVCGAVSGMGIISGLVYATDSPDSKKEIYPIGQALAKEFEDEYGSIICSDLLSSLDNSDRSPVPAERTEEYYKKRSCLDCVKSATEILARNLKENGRI